MTASLYQIRISRPDENPSKTSKIPKTKQIPHNMRKIISNCAKERLLRPRDKCTRGQRLHEGIEKCVDSLGNVSSLACSITRPSAVLCLMSRYAFIYGCHKIVQQ